MVGSVLRAGRHGRARHAPVAHVAPALALPEHHRQLLVVGRASDCDVVVADPTVSRTHAAVMRHAGQWLLLDRGSTNGTTVNGRRIWGTTTVRPGDVVTFGRVAFRLVRGQA